MKPGRARLLGRASGAVLIGGGVCCRSPDVAPVAMTSVTIGPGVTTSTRVMRRKALSRAPSGDHGDTLRDHLGRVGTESPRAGRPLMCLGQE
jgi:hypothetical protein